MSLPARPRTVRFTQPRTVSRLRARVVVAAYVAGWFGRMSAIEVLAYINRVKSFGLITPAEFKGMRRRVNATYHRCAGRHRKPCGRIRWTVGIAVCIAAQLREF